MNYKQINNRLQGVLFDYETKVLENYGEIREEAIKDADAVAKAIDIINELQGKQNEKNTNASFYSRLIRMWQGKRHTNGRKR